MIPDKDPNTSKWVCSPGVYTIWGPKKLRPPRFLDWRRSIRTQYKSRVIFIFLKVARESIFWLLVPAWWFPVTTSPAASSLDIRHGAKLRGVPLLKEKNGLSDFLTPIVGVGNCTCPLPSIAQKILMTKFRLYRISFVSPLWLTSSQTCLEENYVGCARKVALKNLC